MKAALVSPNEQVQTYDWVSDGKGGWYQNWYFIPDAERIAEVTTQPFDIAPPLFWVSCADDDVVADQWYYNKNSQQCVQIIYPPRPAPQQTSTTDNSAAIGPTVVA